MSENFPVKKSIVTPVQTSEVRLEPLEKLVESYAYPSREKILTTLDLVRENKRRISVNRVSDEFTELAETHCNAAVKLAVGLL